MTNRRGEFARLDNYSATLLLSNDLDPFYDYDGIRLLRSLLAKLYRLVERDREDIAGSKYSPPSRIWCRSLDEEIAQAEDGRKAIALTTAKIARSLMARSTRDAEEAFKLLSRAKGEGAKDIERRIRYYALARGSPHLVEEVDRVLKDPEVLSWTVPRREIGDVLRLRFEEASPTAQSLFLHTLKRGPDSSELESFVQRSGSMSEPEDKSLTDDQIRQAVQTWQRRELSRFRANLPAVLLPLADELGFTSSVTDIRQQALVEDGWWSGGAHWVSHGSPVSADDLRTRDPASVIEFVSTWKPTGREDSDDFQGLLHELRKAVSADVSWGGKIAMALGRRDVPLLLRAAVLEGLRDSRSSVEEHAQAEGETERTLFPWLAALDLVSHALELPDDGANEGPDLQSRAYVEAAIGLLGLATSEEVLENHASRVWQLLQKGRELSLTWRAESAAQVQDVEGILIASLNTLSGQLVRATLNVALTQARFTRAKAPEASDAVTPELSRVVSRALDDFLSRASKSTTTLTYSAAGYGALGMMGEYVPQIGYLSSGWLRDNIDTLFAEVSDPMQGPAWVAYITRAVFSDRVFSMARSYYIAAARAANPENEPGGRWSTSEGLAQHALISVLRGTSSIRDKVDELVALTFARVPPENRAHAYWTTYRAWEDHDGAIDSVYIQRAVDFWTWRLTELEAEPASPARTTEAEGLLWFFLTNRVPADLSLDPAARTVRLLDKRATGHLSLFERLASTAEQFPDRTYEIAEVAVGLALSSEYPYIAKEPLTIVLKAALMSGDFGIRQRATQLVHKLGEVTGDASFGDIL